MQKNFRPAIPIGLCDVSSLLEEFSIAEPSLPWAPQYGPYHNGGWYTCTIMNPSGDSNDNVIADGRAKPTELMSRFPKLAKFIAGCGYEVMWARLAKMNVSAALWEHVDYTELLDTTRYRLHVPLRTNQDAALVFPGQAIHLSAGTIWLLDPHSLRHAAVNRGSTSRVHLLLDVYNGPSLEDLIAKAESVCASSFSLPKLKFDQRADLLKRAGRLASLGFVSAAEQLLLSTFLQYDLEEESSYDLLIELYSVTCVLHERCQYWTERRAIHLGKI